MKKKVIIGLIIVMVIALSSIAYLYLGMIKQMNNTDSLYWEDDIQNIEARYQSKLDTEIVFIGSSSIRKWETLEVDFSEYNVVNHGFGGSKVADSTYYYDRLVTAFSPEVIVLFAGTNNIHGMTDQSDSAEEVLIDIKAFYEKSIEALPETSVYYISISPTKARWAVWEEANKANELIRDYCNTVENFTFIDLTEVLMKDNAPNEEILVGDGLHLNETGYDIWKTMIKPIIMESLDH